MIKHFCDCCGNEITDENEIPIKFIAKRTSSTKVKKKIELTVTMIVSKNDVANDGDFCKYCAFDAVKYLDDRPTNASL